MLKESFKVTKSEELSAKFLFCSAPQLLVAYFSTSFWFYSRQHQFGLDIKAPPLHCHCFITSSITLYCTKFINIQLLRQQDLYRSFTCGWIFAFGSEINGPSWRSESVKQQSSLTSSQSNIIRFVYVRFFINSVPNSL